MNIRDARATDLPGLIELEEGAFATDRLSLRSMRRFLASPRARLRVADGAGAVQGYHLILFRGGSAVARLYSLAVARTHRGAGIGEALLADAEHIAFGRGATALRLEVRTDNARAIHLYSRRRYRRIGTVPQYYADGTDAYRYEKSLAAGDGDEDRSRRTAATQPPPMTGRSSPVALTARVTAA